MYGKIDHVEKDSGLEGPQGLVVSLAAFCWKNVMQLKSEDILVVRRTGRAVQSSTESVSLTEIIGNHCPGKIVSPGLLSTQTGVL
jgi:hypothetical protein